MKISKLIPILCAFAAGAIGLTVRAGDNPAQAAARLALIKQLSGSNAQPAANTATPMPANVEVMPANKTMATTKNTAGAAKPETNKISDAERAALMAALMARMNGETQAKSTAGSSAPQSVGTAKTAGGTNSAPAVHPASAPWPAHAPDANYAGKDLGMKPIAGPALPISASKEEQLEALLLRYKADQISPEEYQKQRAEILAQPRN